MKTSLILDKELGKAARQEAAQSGRSIGDVISEWASVGKLVIHQQAKKKTKSPGFKPVNLGGAARVDLRHRRDWMDSLDES